jgi:hypothetical protein
MASGFLAPTGMSNHLLLLDENHGERTVNHQALTRDLLDRKFANLLREALASSSSSGQWPHRH